MTFRTAPAAVLALALLVCACSSGDEEARPSVTRESRADGERREPRPQPRHRPAPASCPSSLENCSAASGRILYVERVDPDGDGDAHFVLLSRQGISGPGITVIDVKRALRPFPLPGPGDRLSAAGPVYTGSYGQRQIEATELHVAR
jgi:hypothetical protein